LNDQDFETYHLVTPWS